MSKLLKKMFKKKKKRNLINKLVYEIFSEVKMDESFIEGILNDIFQYMLESKDIEEDSRKSSEILKY